MPLDICRNCEGLGIVEVYAASDPQNDDRIQTTCQHCDGTGFYRHFDEEECDFNLPQATKDALDRIAEEAHARVRSAINMAIANALREQRRD